MTSTIKLTIQKKDGTPAGPYHWKHIVEWHEFELMSGFYWTNLDGELQPVSDLIDDLGVPPTICTHTILHSPKHHKKNPNSEIMRKLKVIGFSKDIQSVDDDLGKHLLHRLLMSDEALNAEDPDFQIKNPESYPTIAAETPSVSTGSEDSVNPSPETMTDKPETTNDDAPETEAPRDTSKLAVDPALNPFIEGEEVANVEDIDDDGFTPVKKSGFKRVIIVPLLLVIVITAGAYVFIENQKQAQTPEAPAEEALPVASEETPLSEVTETVEEVVAEVTETAEAITSDIKETVEATAEEVKEAVEGAVAEKVSEVEETIESAVTDALSNVSNEITDATSDTELPTDGIETMVDDAVDGVAPEVDETVEGTEVADIVEGIAPEVDNTVEGIEATDTVEMPEVESDTTEASEDDISEATTDEVVSSEDIADETAEMEEPESSETSEDITNETSETEEAEPSQAVEDIESDEVVSSEATEEVAVDETATSEAPQEASVESSEEVEEDTPAPASSIVIDSTGETVDLSDLPSSAQAKRRR